MELSIIIVTHNSLPVVLNCLDSISEHPPSCSYEVIVVDNASVDGTADAVSARFPQVIVKKNRENLGYSRGVNQGIDKASGRWILILNPDIEVQDGSIDKLIEFMEETPDAGITGSKLVYPDGTLQYSCRAFYTLSALILRRTFLGRVFPRARALREHLMMDYDHAEPRRVDWIIGACMLVRREALEKVGKMDERFFLYFEDLDWCYRMAKQGWNVYYVPESVMVHRYERSSAHSLINKSLLIHIFSMFRYVEKWNSLFYFFRKNRTLIKSLVLMISDLSAINLSFFAAYFLRDLLQPLFVHELYPVSWYIFFILFYNLIFLFVFSVTGLYQVHRETPASREFIQITKAVLLGLVILMAATYTSRVRIYSRAVIFGQGVFSILVVFMFRQVIRRVHRDIVAASFDLKRVLLVGNDDEAERFVGDSVSTRRLGIDIVGVVGDGERVLGPAEAIADIVERFRVQEIIVLPSFAKRGFLTSMVPLLMARSIQIKVISELAAFIGKNARVDETDGLYFFSIEPGFTLRIERLIKRVFDIVIALLLLPFIMVASVFRGVTISLSKGKSVEWERRVGFRGKAIRWLKIRKSDGGIESPLNEWILLYIVSGRMSFVGPPPLYQEVYRRNVFIYDSFRPGITGLWRKGSGVSVDEALSQEAVYLRNWSLSNDLLIFLGCLPILISATYPDWFYKKEKRSAS